jgi:hypothetical protein
VRISVEKDDRGYDPNHLRAHVFLNDVELLDCITADDELGECYCYARDASGNFLTAGDTIQREFRYGKVRIELEK